MQIGANSVAKFFIQKEYDHVEIQSDWLLISSNSRQERISFSQWCGKITLERGVIWGSLKFHAHVIDGKEQCWLIQGLPWQQSRVFASKAIKCYQQWHQQQSLQLNRALPLWQRELTRLVNLPAFLPHSLVVKWADSVERELEQISMTLEEACLMQPQAMMQIGLWLNNSEQQLAQRNQQWLEIERSNWTVLFSRVESSPLNISQQQAVLLNNDFNLVLAGAGSGKTSVLVARVSYLLQGHLAQAEQILMLAFGRDAAAEMQQRLAERVGAGCEKVTINTFHQLGLHILKQVQSEAVEISPLALDSELKKAWCSEWLKKHWLTPLHLNRWQKHLSEWPIAFLKGDDELVNRSDDPKLIAWLEKQLEQLCALGVSKKDLLEMLVSHQDYSRLNSELSLCWPCYQAWQDQLKESNTIDFPTMIHRATDYVKKGRFISPWTAIMIDEYQDISPDRLALVEALSQRRSEDDFISLFAVGDDWQAIYQFAGADVSLTTDFARRFPCSTIHYLDTTYRFNNQIGLVANKFVQKNPLQLKKTLNSFKQQKQKAVTVIPMAKMDFILEKLNDEAKSLALSAKSKTIISESLNPSIHITEKRSVLLLGRNHYHRPQLFDELQQTYPYLAISFMTCHASKGKEADYVLILNVDEGQFPASQRQQHLDSALINYQDTFPVAEERRLFYVALTRAKEKVWVMYSGRGSDFVKELMKEDYPVIKP